LKVKASISPPVLIRLLWLWGRHLVRLAMWIIVGPFRLPAPQTVDEVPRRHKKLTAEQIGV